MGEHAMLTSRFWDKVEFTDTCWNWTAGTNAKGYGQIRHEGRPHGAHRLAYIDANGPIPDDHHIDHLCRNRACVRPSHMEAVLPATNVRRGDLAKLTLDIARSVRSEYAEGGVTLQQLADRHGVHRMTIAHVIHNRTWKEEIA